MIMDDGILVYERMEIKHCGFSGCRFVHLLFYGSQDPKAKPLAIFFIPLEEADKRALEIQTVAATLERAEHDRPLS